jgi:hypothetical protein
MIDPRFATTTTRVCAMSCYGFLWLYQLVYSGFCLRGNECWFRHVPPTSQSVKEKHAVEEEGENVCCICLEKPTTYGLLGTFLLFPFIPSPFYHIQLVAAGCSHIFCIQVSLPLVVKHLHFQHRESAFANGAQLKENPGRSFTLA